MGAVGVDAPAATRRPRSRRSSASTTSARRPRRWSRSAPCSTPAAMVTIGAASRDQARICFERMRGFAEHPAPEDVLVARHLELRHEDGDGLLRVVPSDGPRVHGLSSTLYIGDEVWAWPANGELLEAMQTGLIRRRDSKLLLISTAAARLDSPLGRLRARALAQPSAKRTGSVVEPRGGLHWLEWSVLDDVDLDDLDAVKRANPAPWTMSRTCAASAPPYRRQRTRTSTPAGRESARARGFRRAPGRHASASPSSRRRGRLDRRRRRRRTLGNRRRVGQRRLHVGAAIYHGDPGVLEAVDHRPRPRRPVQRVGL